MNPGNNNARQKRNWTLKKQGKPTNNKPKKHVNNPTNTLTSTNETHKQIAINFQRNTRPENHNSNICANPKLPQLLTRNFNPPKSKPS